MFTDRLLQGVISYSVHPGGIDTPLAKNMPPEFHGEYQFSTRKKKKRDQ